MLSENKNIIGVNVGESRQISDESWKTIRPKIKATGLVRMYANNNISEQTKRELLYELSKNEKKQKEKVDIKLLHHMW